MFGAVWGMYFPFWFRWTNWRWQLRRSLIMYLEWLNRRYIQPTGLLSFTSNVHFILTLTSPISCSYTTDCCFLSAESWLKYMFCSIYSKVQWRVCVPDSKVPQYSCGVVTPGSDSVVWEAAWNSQGHLLPLQPALAGLQRAGGVTTTSQTPLWPTWTQFDCLSTSH